MANLRFQHVDGVFTNPNNWGGVTPGDGDSLFFTPGSQSLTSGLDQHTISFDTITTDADYSGSIGSASLPLQTTCQLLDIRGRGTIYYDDDDYTQDGLTDTTGTILVRSRGALNRALVLTGNKVDKLIIYYGGVVSTGITTISKGYVIRDRNANFTQIANLRTEQANGEWIIQHGDVNFTSPTVGNISNVTRILQSGGKIHGAGAYSMQELIITGGVFETAPQIPSLQPFFVWSRLEMTGGTLDQRGLAGQLLIDEQLVPPILMISRPAQIFKRRDQSEVTLGVTSSFFVDDGVFRND